MAGTNETEPEGRSAPRAAADDSDLSQLEAAHLDGRLMHELSALNYLTGQYVVRHYDAEAGRATPTPVADEMVLARSVIAAGEAIRARAQRRKRQADNTTSGSEDA